MAICIWDLINTTFEMALAVIRLQMAMHIVENGPEGFNQDLESMRGETAPNSMVDGLMEEKMDQGYGKAKTVHSRRILAKWATYIQENNQK